MKEENQIIQEAVVAAALANRADTCKAGKAQWGNKLPTAGTLAKTGALKAREALKAMDAGNNENGKVKTPWKGARGGRIAKFAQTPNIKDDEAEIVEQERKKGKPKLRIQRGR